MYRTETKPDIFLPVQCLTIEKKQLLSQASLFYIVVFFRSLVFSGKTFYCYNIRPNPPFLKSTGIWASVFGFFRETPGNRVLSTLFNKNGKLEFLYIQDFHLVCSRVFSPVNDHERWLFSLTQDSKHTVTTQSQIPHYNIQDIQPKNELPTHIFSPLKALTNATGDLCQHRV